MQSKPPQQIHHSAIQLKFSQLLTSPELLRLCTDFDLCVLEAAGSEETELSLFYALLTSPYQQQAQTALTPYFNSLNALESHIKQHSITILNHYLFGVPELESNAFGLLKIQPLALATMC